MTANVATKPRTNITYMCEQFVLRATDAVTPFMVSECLDRPKGLVQSTLGQLAHKGRIDKRWINGQVWFAKLPKAVL